MTEFEYVIAAMDEENLAADAVAAALQLSRKFHARLDVLHAIHVKRSIWSMEDEAHWAKMRAEITSRARVAVMQKLRAVLDSCGASDVSEADVLHVVDGRPSEALVERANRLGAALIVMGPHKDRGMFDFGGTTREVLRRARCPLWLQNRPWSDIRRVIVPIDLSPGSSKIFECADAIRAALGAEIEIVHCFEPPRSSYGWQPNFIIQDYRKAVQRQVDQFAERVAPGREVKRSVIDGEPAAKILALQEPEDLVVLGTHGHSALSQVTLGSQACIVLRRSELPVVAVPHEGREAIG